MSLIRRLVSVCLLHLVVVTNDAGTSTLHQYLCPDEVCTDDVRLNLCTDEVRTDEVRQQMTLVLAHFIGTGPVHTLTS